MIGGRKKVVDLFDQLVQRAFRQEEGIEKIEMNPITIIKGLIVDSLRYTDDPDKAVGCSVYFESKDQFIFGFNRMPRGIIKNTDRLIRPVKYEWIEHAERDLITTAARKGVSLRNQAMYMTWFPCTDCARSIINSGIVKLYYPEGCVDPKSKWADNHKISKEMLLEAQVELIEVQL